MNTELQFIKELLDGRLDLEASRDAKEKELRGSISILKDKFEELTKKVSEQSTTIMQLIKERDDALGTAEKIKNQLTRAENELEDKAIEEAKK